MVNGEWNFSSLALSQTPAARALKHHSLFTIHHSLFLERQSYAQLHLPRGGGGRADAAEGRERLLVVGRAGEGDEGRRREVRPVEEVESLDAQLQRAVVAEPAPARVLHEREVEGAQVRADERAAPDVAEGARGRQAEGRRVEVLVGAAQDRRLGVEARREV